MRRSMVGVVGVLGLLSVGARGQVADAPDAVIAKIPVNYTEAKVGAYVLPDPLVMRDGSVVRDEKGWFERRRPEILRLFEEHQFGRSPGRPEDLSFEVLEAKGWAFDGKAVRRQVRVYFTKDKAAGPKMDLLIYLPAAVSGPVPVLLNAGFTANSLAVDDPEVKQGEVWNAREKRRVPAVRVPGRRFGGLNVLPTIEKGFGIASVYYGDIDPDSPGAVEFGVRKHSLKPGQTEPAADEWGAIGAWAWGLSRAMDYFETDADVDAKRVALVGVSRLGKTVLWAGARDPRFAMVIASCSGEGGAALGRRNYGETIAHMVAPGRYPYQFCGGYAAHAADPGGSPVDAHLLLALIAPRPVLLQTGDADRWSDPKGEFLAAVAAGPVYELLGKEGLKTDRMPAAGEPVLHTLGYYMHKGGHGMIPSDWETVHRFMAMHLKR